MDPIKLMSFSQGNLISVFDGYPSLKQAFKDENRKKQFFI